ncbi:MAG: DedA family protein [Myxococcales bacterium]|nr:DedA family protein [Myxococcales bacterium]
MEWLRKAGRLPRRLYDWTLHWAETPYAVPALALLAFAESSFFPVPPDVLLIVLALGAPKRSFWFAAVCSIASVAGGLLGYAIGYFVWQGVDQFFFTYVFSEEAFRKVAELYQDNAFWAVFTAGFTPIPYKVFTITGGVCQIDLPTFVLASAISRSLRFFAVAALFFFFGPPIKRFIDKYFNLLAVVFTVLLIGGFVVIKYAV